jgi:hypothetical protein
MGSTLPRSDQFAWGVQKHGQEPRYAAVVSTRGGIQKLLVVTDIIFSPCKICVKIILPAGLVAPLNQASGIFYLTEQKIGLIRGWL